MDLSFLNFQKILIVLSAKDMRINILKIFQEQQIEADIKFADSYFEAASLINESIHNPYRHVILNLSANNRKLRDFVEFIKPSTTENPAYLVEYTEENELLPVELLD